MRRTGRGARSDDGLGSVTRLPLAHVGLSYWARTTSTRNLQVDPRAESEGHPRAVLLRAPQVPPRRRGRSAAHGRLPMRLGGAWESAPAICLRREAGPTNSVLRDAERADAHGDNGQARGETPPRSRLDSSSILDFGRYAGWSHRSDRRERSGLPGVAGADPDRTPAGGRAKRAPRVPGSVRSPVGVGRGGPQKRRSHW